MTKYQIIVEVSLEKLLPAAGQTIDQINGFMAGFGFNEKITLRSEIPLTVEGSRPLTQEEETLLIKTTLESMKNLNPSLKSFSKIY